MDLTKISAVLLTILLLAPSGLARMPITNTQIAPAMFVQTTTGTLIGTVVDVQNGPIAGVLVQVVNTTNGFGYGRRTDTTGTYRIDFLPAGVYDIKAEAEGYQPNLIPNYLVEVNREKVIKPPPIQLLPVSAPPAPTPPANLPAPGTLQANIADATLRGSATAEFITALPLAGIRSFDTFALLVPGVAPPPATFGANGPGIGPGVGTAGQFSVNGQRARANNFTIDGSDNNDQDVGVRRQGFTPAIPQSVESIREFEITTLLADAEAGRNTGGQINVVSRSGSNQVHGEFYDFLTDSALNARDFFDLKGGPSGGENPFTRNQLGGAIAAPLLKDRLHLFAALERQDVNRSQEIHFSVPTLAQRQSATRLGSQLGRSLQALRFGQDVLGLYPLPNNPGGPYVDNTFTQVLAASGDGTLFSLKFDYQFRPFGKLSTFTGRYNFTDDDTRIPTVDGALNSSLDADTRTQNIAFTLNTELTANAANQVRLSFGRTSLGFTEVAGSPFIFQSALATGDRTGDGIPDSRTGPLGRLLLVPFSPIGVDPFTFPQGRANNTFQIADTFVLTKGKYTLKFGADIRRVQFNSFLDRNYRPQLAITPNFLIALDGSSLGIGSGADFAGIGLPSDFLQALAVTPDSSLGLRFTETNFFIDNNILVHPRVTLNFGLRYERNSVPTDDNRRLERALAVQESDISFDPNDDFSLQFINSVRAQRRFIAGREKIYDNDNNNFAPRVGIAWDLFGDGRTSLRGGYGIFYDSILGNIVSQSRNQFPNFIPVNFGSALNSQINTSLITVNPAFITFGINDNIRLIQPGTVNTIGLSPAQLAFGLGRLSTFGFGIGFTLPDKELRTPYVQHFSVALERAIFDRYVATVAYVGTRGRKLIRFRTPNGGQFTPFAATADLNIPLLRRPERSLGVITIFESSANADYNALQASLARQLANGLGFQLAYTYAHAIDEVSDVFDLAGSFALAQDELGRREGLRAERGSANFDIRHRFTAAWQYDLPFARQNRFLGGFRLAGILTLQTGQPFTVNTSVDANVDGNLTDRLSTTNGLIISDQGRTRIRLAPGSTPQSFLAFTDPLNNPTNGSVGRNTFRAAGVAVVDLALDKRFTITESQIFTVRMEVFNLFNRSHFAIPVRILEAPGFGSSVSTSLPARSLQFALRYSF
ncbi:MAG: TonB-dependent receptor [Acidobacteriota bacterium]